MKLLVALVACLAVAASVNAQSCPLTAQDASKIDYSGISPACCKCLNVLISEYIKTRLRGAKDHPGWHEWS